MPNGHGGVPFLGAPILLAVMFAVLASLPPGLQGSLGWVRVAFCLVLAGATVTLDTPDWLVTVLVSLLVTAVVVVIQIRKPSYHGLGWQWINPGLPAWWESQMADRSEDDAQVDERDLRHKRASRIGKKAIW